jgi:5-methylcytosine-specific restriction endonuclease McrA
LKRDCYECQECKKEGKLTIKQHGKKLDIHHIKEIETHPELTYVRSNLLTVCVHHHNILDNKVLNKSTKKFINEEKW